MPRHVRLYALDPRNDAVTRDAPERERLHGPDPDCDGASPAMARHVLEVQYMTDYERETVRETVDRPLTQAPVVPPEAPYAPPPVARTTVTRTSARTSQGPNVVGVVTLIFGILQTLLLLRVLLLLLVANNDNVIVSGILSITDPFVEPFRGMFRLDQVSSRSGSMLDVAALVALVGWTLIEALIVAVLRIGDRRATADA